MGLVFNKLYKKFVRIVGEVMGKYYFYGDLFIYEVMVCMSQDFKMRVFLVDMYGNNGFIDGDFVVVMCYIEVRLFKEVEFLFKDIDKRIVNFVFNFDDEE